MASMESKALSCSHDSGLGISFFSGLHHFSGGEVVSFSPVRGKTAGLDAAGTG